MCKPPCRPRLPSLPSPELIFLFVQVQLERCLGNSCDLTASLDVVVVPVFPDKQYIRVWAFAYMFLFLLIFFSFFFAPVCNLTIRTG